VHNMGCQVVSSHALTCCCISSYTPTVALTSTSCVASLHALLIGVAPCLTPLGHRPRRVKTSKEVKEQVYRTYGENCHLCSYWVPLGQRTVDHVKTVRAGGSTLLGNCRPCHSYCHQLRGARPLTDALKAEIKAAYERDVLAAVRHKVAL
jgi:hypothetical protein